MKKSILYSFCFFIPFIGSYGQNNGFILPDSLQFYFGPYAGRAMMYADCYEWNAVHIIQEKYNLQFGEKFAGCIPTEETDKAFKRMNKQNDLVNQEFRRVGILPAGGTVDDLVWQEAKRQKRLEELMRKQVFFQEKEEEVLQPVYIQAIPLESINQYEVKLYQEDHKGEMWRWLKVHVDLEASEINVLDTNPEKYSYPWTCWSRAGRRFEEPCSIVGVVAGVQSDCDPNSNTYSQELIIDHRVDLQRGSPIQVQGRRFSIDDKPGPQKVMLDGLVADGMPVDVNVTSDRDRREGCKAPFISVFVAPKACKMEEMRPAPETNPSLEIFPNPTNDQAVLRIQLNSASKVRIDIFNLNGRLTRSVFDGEIEEGLHEWNWDGRSENGSIALPGTYIIRVQTGQGKVLAKRLTKAY